MALPEALERALPLVPAELRAEPRAPDDGYLDLLRELPFKARPFDAVCSFAALHLFADPFRAHDRMTDVLTPGGRVAIFTSCRGRSAPLRIFESAVERRSGMRMFERMEIVGALRDRGFTQFVGGRLSG